MYLFALACAPAFPNKGRLLNFLCEHTLGHL